MGRGQTIELAVFTTRGTATYPLTHGKALLIGRSDDADIPIHDCAVSRRHAVIHFGPPLEIEDLGSANGTLVSPEPSSDGSQTEQQTRVRGARLAIGLGDTVHFGAARIMVREASPSREGDYGDIVVRDPALKRVFDEASRAAQMTIPVLILGETGVGKDVVARFIHERSPRAKRPFVALNCAALTESIVEGELFGHERGAFTGAQQSRAGLFEAADGGTVFLDEIGELALATQAKLLRALESQEIVRVGSAKPVRVDVRFVAATNKDLEHRASEGHFRRDLYFRVNGVALHVPPLRARTSEIGDLARRFLAAGSRELGLEEPPAITPEAMQILEAYAWPGNVRELRFMMERAMLSAGSGPIRPEHLPPAVATESTSERARFHELTTRERIVDALAEADGNQTVAAAKLGVSRRTLINRMIEYGLPRPRKP